MAGLRSLDVELEAVTPLWIGGADASGRATSRRRCGAACASGSGRWPAVCWEKC